MRTALAAAAAASVADSRECSKYLTIYQSYPGLLQQEPLLFKGPDDVVVANGHVSWVDNIFEELVCPVG